MSLLEVRDLSVRFRGTAGQPPVRAVDGVSFEVRPGEAVGLVGESGCGKTVTSLAIMGLLPTGASTHDGSIRFRGDDIGGWSEERRRELRGLEMSMIFQDPMSALNPVFRVGDQVAEALRRRRGVAAAEARRSVRELFREVGLGDPERVARQYPHQLSGGMAQRVLIALAISLQPSLLIADEPTTALDVTVQAQILRLLKGLLEHRDMGMLLVTHDLGVVAGVCDRVMVMYGGRIVEAGAAAKVFEHPRHPYTRGLLGSLPRLEERRGRLRPIRGSVPRASAWPQGCRFHPRCDYAWERCCAQEPPLLEAGPLDSAARCWLLDEPARDRRGPA